MIELLSKSVEGQIRKEVKKQTQHLRGSALEDDAVGDGIPNEHQVGAEGEKNYMKKVLETKVSKVEIVDYLKGKSSKKDLEVVMRQIQILHKQLK